MATCYRHPGRETVVSCSDCGRPICPDCMVAAPVGIKCPDCARQPRSARATIKPDRALRAIAAVAGAGLVLGYINLVVITSFGLLGIFYPFLMGMAIGRVVLWAGGRYRGRSSNAIAIGGAVWCYIVPLIVISLAPLNGVGFTELVASAARAPFYVIGLAIAIFSAYREVQ